MFFLTTLRPFHTSLCQTQTQIKRWRVYYQ